MDKNLKENILVSLHTIYLETLKDSNDDFKFRSMSDILNLIKIVEGWEDLSSDIQKMLNDKAYRDKFNLQRGDINER